MAGGSVEIWRESRAGGLRNFGPRTAELFSKSFGVSGMDAAAVASLRVRTHGEWERGMYRYRPSLRASMERL